MGWVTSWARDPKSVAIQECPNSRYGAALASDRIGVPEELNSCDQSWMKGIEHGTGPLINVFLDVPNDYGQMSNRVPHHVLQVT